MTERAAQTAQTVPLRVWPTKPSDRGRFAPHFGRTGASEGALWTKGNPQGALRTQLAYPDRVTRRVVSQVFDAEPCT